MPPDHSGWRNSLARRIAAAHGLFGRATADLELVHVNRVERAGVLPIAFSLVHLVCGEDRNASDLLDAGPPLLAAHRERIGLTEDPPRRGTPMATAERVRIADLGAWREYQRQVFERTERALAAMDPRHLGDPLFDGKRPDLGTSFLGLLVPSGPIRRGDALEAFVYQHAVRHCGEIEHARALAGLPGIS